MKIFKHLIFCSFVYLGSLFGAGIDDLGKQAEDRMKLAEIGKEYWEDSEEDDTWIIFVKQLDTEKFLVRFPSDPEDEFLMKSADEKAFRYHSSEDGVEYIVHAIQGRSDLEYMGEHLEKIRSSNYHNLSEGTLAQDELGWMMDLSYEDPLISGDGTKTLYKERVFVTEKNTYHILTKYPEGQEENHEDFLQSFEIVLPFPGRK